MSVQVEKLEKNMAKLTVEVPAEDVEKAIQGAYQKTKKSINIPGFRKGKAPRQLIEKMYGKEVFYSDAVDAMLPKAYSDAVEECGEEIVSYPKIDVVQIESGKPFIFTAEVAVKPAVTLGEYKGIQVEKAPIEVTDEEIEAQVNKEREANSRTVTVEDRAVQKGDIATIDFEGFVDGVAFDGGKGENYDLEIGSNTFIPGFEDQLVGAEIGKELDVNVTFPEEYGAKELAGKEAVFKCKVNGIKVKELPAVDDEFAQEVSEFDTLDELKKDIRAKLTEAAEKSAETAVEEQLVEQVVESMEAEIPQCMVDRKTDEMLQEFDYRLQSQGLNLDLYMKYTGFSADSFKETYKEQALNQVKIRLALEEIVKLEKIEVTEEELNAEFEKMASAYSMDLEKIKELVPAEDIKLDLAVNKAIDLIKSSAEVSESAPEKKKAPAKKKAAAKEEKADEDGEKKAPAKKKTTKKKAEETKDAE